ncbi:MGT family glycosyltransferase [Allocatelliglobosispora scoriae]|uniref:MGT family glycosyltransferase n=1 Tax=Allocatelliglobosispora scoriae TaxID=643052 RepID=A0A841BYS1_9ACTN|nr:macrolide family glycosyltransferase [Allocatelliglobosispora scoriae]MBB5873284.1 MGT family glycosyltransferase [Allocatelliglobosispora scoriae]
MGRHIAFVNAPLTGEIFPTLPIVDALVRRGHRVTYATVPARAAALESVGAEVVTYRSTLPDDGDRGLSRPDRMEYVPMVRRNFLAEAAATLPQLDEAYRDDVPDLIVYRTAMLAGRILTARYGVPSVELWPYLANNEHWSISRHLAVADPESPAGVAFRADIDEFVAAQLDDPKDFHRAEPRHRLMFYPRSFQYRGETFGDGFTFVGPCVGRRPFQESWQPGGGDRPIALISLGTVYNRHIPFYRAAMDAFADSSWQVLLGIGHRTSPAELGDIPANVHVAATVPQFDILRHASVFVTHAGMGSVMEALLCGVPMVTVPQTPEQEVNAERVVELGVGGRLDADGLTAEALRAEVERVVADDAMAHRLGELRREVQACGGAGLAADLIESV